MGIGYDSQLPVVIIAKTIDFLCTRIVTLGHVNTQNQSIAGCVGVQVGCIAVGTACRHCHGTVKEFTIVPAALAHTEDTFTVVDLLGHGNILFHILNVTGGGAADTQLVCIPTAPSHHGAIGT